METAKQIGIHSGTRIKVLLDADKQGVIDALVTLNKNFSKLKNPVLRNLFASRITIADACKIANCKIGEFLSRMRDIGFLIIEVPSDQSALNSHKGIDFSRDATVFELDARPYLENNRDPLKEIIALVNKLAPGERLKITNTFEPTPLINLLSDKGFSYDIKVAKDNVVIVWFEKNHMENMVSDQDSLPETGNDQQLFNRVLSRFPQEQIQYIDVRDLPMPRPMLLILEQIDSLPSDGLLYVYHKKVPVFLLPDLNKRGMLFLVHHKSASAVDILIYRS